VKPWETRGRALAPDGTELVLAHRDGEWVVRYGGRVLMSSRQHGSEEALAALALPRAKHRRQVLVGGLGLGHTLRAALDRVPATATVTVAELTPALVEWNRGPVAALAGRPLDDPRTQLHLGDAVALIEATRGRFDAILLDIDNGPASAVHQANSRLYGPAGVAACHGALAAGGCLAVWSAHHDGRYLERLGRGGFRAEARVVPARGQAGGAKHVVFLGVKEGGGGPAAGRRRR
jgi:spermidine synthase